MRWLRHNTPLVVVAIGVVAFAACLLGSGPGLVLGVLSPLWLVVPAVLVTLVRRSAVRVDEQVLPLLWVLFSRPPPSALAPSR